LKAVNQLLGGLDFLSIAPGRHHGVGMGLPRSMTRFTARSKFRLFGICLRVNCLRKLLCLVLMTSRAGFNSRVVLRLCIWWRLPGNRGALSRSWLLLGEGTRSEEATTQRQCTVSGNPEYPLSNTTASNSAAGFAFWRRRSIPGSSTSPIRPALHEKASTLLVRA
jgi:hypothetical protein